MRSPSTAGWQTSVARLLVAVMLVVSAGPLLHAADGHDADFGPMLVLHDCTHHDRELSAPGAGGLPEIHCAACHLGRHLRAASGVGAEVFGLFVAGARLVHEHDRAPRSAAVPSLPARAPPASLFG